MVAGGWVLGVLVTAAAASAQGPAAAPAASRSVRDGVYTEAQAARGQKTYDTLCIACHEVKLWRDHWAGRPLSEMFNTIRMDMPEDNPGSLSAGQARDVVAHILKTNDLPAGPVDLSDDPAVLREIRMEPAAP